MDEMIDWYQTALGFEVRFKHPVMAFLSFDDEHHRVALINLSALDPEGGRVLNARTGTLEHSAFTYPTAKDLLSNYVRLKDLGITPFWCVHHGMTLSLYYKDPDDNQIEFQVEVYADAEAANAFLSTDVFMKNPIGVEYDPEALVERMKNDASETELLNYTPGPMAMPPESKP
jgi:catechol-2,3-dioxygenase